MLTMGADHFEVDWEAMWRDKLANSAAPTGERGDGWRG
jgi:hypothetical protein